MDELDLLLYDFEPEAPKEVVLSADYLDLCKALQEGITTADPLMADQIRHSSLEIAKSTAPDTSGSNMLALHALKAYMLPDNLTIESNFKPTIEYGEMRMTGRLAGPSLVKFGQMHLLNWCMFDAKIQEVMTKNQEEERFPKYIDTFRRPIYVPVGMIENVLHVSR